MAQPPERGVVRLGHFPEKDARRADLANSEQRRKKEEERGNNSDEQPLDGSAGGWFELRRQIHQTAQQRGKDDLNNITERHSECAPQDPDEKSLKQVNANDLARAPAEAFQDGNAVKFLLNIRVDGRADAQAPDEQCEQADQAEKIGHALQTLRQRRVRVPVIGNSNAPLQPCLQDAPRGLQFQASRRKPEEKGFGGAASVLDQAAALQPLARDENARPQLDP